LDKSYLNAFGNHLLTIIINFKYLKNNYLLNNKFIGGFIVNANAQLNSFPIDNVIQLIRKKWVVQIINDLFFGKSRFHEFKEDKPKLSNRVLSSCLKDMEDNGLIKRIADKYDKKNVRYYLTEKGRSLNKIMYEMAIFSVDRENYTDKTKTELKSVFREKLL